jgi:NAD(P)H-hydrate epimerase
MNKIKWADVVCIGPGIGREFETAEFIKLFCKKSQFKFAVIDADAIIALKEILDQIDLTNCILTPHLGEFSQLIDIPIDEIKKDLLQFGSEFARKYRTTLVLKGAPTITFNRLGEAFINSTGNSGLAKFGSGDVLTGFIAGLLSQSKNLVNSAIAAVYLHGLAADLLRIKKTEYGIMSSQLIKKFPDAINFLQGLSDV